MSKVLTQILAYVASLGQALNQLLSSVGTASGPATGHGGYNWLIIGFVLFVVFLVGFTMGRTRMLLALVAIYAAAFLEAHFIYFPQLQVYFSPPAGGLPEYWVHIGLFIVWYVTIFGILNRSILKGRLAVKEASMLAISLEAILIVGLLASIVIGYLPTEVTKQLPIAFLKYFTNKNAQFIWAAGPVLAALLLRGKKSEF